MLTHRILSRGSATAHGLDAGPLDANANMYSIFLDNLPVSMYISRSTSMRWGKINRGKGAKVGRPRNSQRRTMDDDNTKLAEMGGSLHGPILYREWNCYPRWREAPWELIVKDIRGTIINGQLGSGLWYVNDALSIHKAAVSWTHALAVNQIQLSDWLWTMLPLLYSSKYQNMYDDAVGTRARTQLSPILPPSGSDWKAASNYIRFMTLNFSSFFYHMNYLFNPKSSRIVWKKEH